MTDSDAADVRAITTQGSDAAIRALVDRHSPRLLAVAVRFLAADVDAAEDVLQQSWINAIGALPRFRGESTFATWMTRIVIRTAIDYLRTRDQHLDLESTHVLARVAPPDAVDDRVDVERL